MTWIISAEYLFMAQLLRIIVFVPIVSLGFTFCFFGILKQLNITPAMKTRMKSVALIVAITLTIGLLINVIAMSTQNHTLLNETANNTILFRSSPIFLATEVAIIVFGMAAILTLNLFRLTKALNIVSEIKGKLICFGFFVGLFCLFAVLVEAFVLF